MLFAAERGFFDRMDCRSFVGQCDECPVHAGMFHDARGIGGSTTTLVLPLGSHAGNRHLGVYNAAATVQQISQGRFILDSERARHRPVCLRQSMSPNRDPKSMRVRPTDLLNAGPLDELWSPRRGELAIFPLPIRDR